MGLYRYRTWKQNELEDIRNNSMLKCLTDGIFNIIVEYAKHYEKGLSVKFSSQIFMNSGIELIDKYFGEPFGTNNYPWFKYSDDHIQIIDIICEYLPIYQYNDDIPSTQYAVIGCSAMSNYGINEGIDWISNAIKYYKKKKK